MEYFLQLVNTTSQMEVLGFSVPSIILFFALLLGFYTKIYKGMWIPYYDGQKKKDEQLNKTVERVEELYALRETDRKDMLECRKEIQDSLTAVYASQQEMFAAQMELQNKLDKSDARIKAYEQSTIRGELLKAYRYFTNEQCNPTLSWTEMEQHSFEEQLKSYKEAGGNSYILEVVQPAMDKLLIVHMSDLDGVAKLYQSRSQINLN